MTFDYVSREVTKLLLLGRQSCLVVWFLTFLSTWAMLATTLQYDVLFPVREEAALEIVQGGGLVVWCAPLLSSLSLSQITCKVPPEKDQAARLSQQLVWKLQHCTPSYRPFPEGCFWLWSNGQWSAIRSRLGQLDDDGWSNPDITVSRWTNRVSVNHGWCWYWYRWWGWSSSIDDGHI